VHDAEAVVVAPEDVVHVVGRLLRGVLVVGAEGLEAHHLARAEEDAQQVGQQRVDHLRHVAADHAAAAVHLVAERPAVVVVQRPVLLGGDAVGVEAGGLALVLLQQGDERAFVQAAHRPPFLRRRPNSRSTWASSSVSRVSITSNRSSSARTRASNAMRISLSILDRHPGRSAAESRDHRPAARKPQAGDPGSSPG
jgi:hypothetical protein